MSSLAGTLRRGLRDAAVALRVAPVEVALGIAVAVGWSFALAEGTPEAMQAWAEVATVGVLTGGIAWIATLLHGLGALSSGRRWLLTLAGFAVVVVYSFTLLDFDRTAEGWRAALLIATGALSVTLVPLATVQGDDRDRRFREVNLRLLTRVVGVALYAGTLYLGLALAISAVDSLFELHLDSDIYGHVFGAIAFGVAPWIVVGGAPGITAEPAPAADGMRVVRRFGVYLFLPLLAIYYLILYAYLVRIAITTELPRNLVSPLALLAGMIGAVGIMMFVGARESSERREPGGVEPDPAPPTSGGVPPNPAEGVPAPSGRRGPGGAAGVPLLVRLAAPLFLPLGALGLWGVGARVAQYGWTEFRYVRDAALVALLLLAVLGSWALVRRARLRAYPVPLVLALGCLWCALGPWSASAVARRSQQARLALALNAADVDTAAVDRGAAGTRLVADSLYREIRGTGSYLAEHFGSDAVAAVAGRTAVGKERGYDLAAVLGLKARPDLGALRVVTARLVDALPIEALGAGSLYFIEVPSRHDTTLAGDFRDDSTVLQFRLGNRTLRADLAPLAAWALNADSTGASTVVRDPRGRMVPRPSVPVRIRASNAVVPLLDVDGRNAGRFAIQWLMAEGDSAAVRLRAVEGLAVVSPPGG